MSLVEEEHELRLLEIARLGQRFEKLGQQPKQERRIELRCVDELIGGEQIQHAFAADGLHEIFELDRRFAKEMIAALFVDLQQPALDRTDRGRRDVAVLQRQLAAFCTDRTASVPADP